MVGSSVLQRQLTYPSCHNREREKREIADQVMNAEVAGDA